MGNIKFYLIVFVLSVLGIGILWSVVEPIVFWTSKSEVRIYCRLALILGGVAVFGILRLYNAVMGYTSTKIYQAEVEKRLTQSNLNSEKQSRLISRDLQKVTSALERNTEALNK